MYVRETIRGAVKLPEAEKKAIIVRFLLRCSGKRESIIVCPTAPIGLPKMLKSVRNRRNDIYVAESPSSSKPAVRKAAAN